jgi:FixJ family two-component response regulator
MAVVHVVDDDASFQAAIARLLRAAGYEVRTYSGAGEFLLSPAEAAPGCVLLDLQMPGLSGLDLQEALEKRGALLPIIFLTGQGDIPRSVKAMKSGAVDFLTKPVEGERLLGAIRIALALDQSARASRDQLEEWRQRFAKLTARERDVHAMVVAGKRNKVIALELGTAERTIKVHRARVMTKMAVRSLAELVRIADQLQQAESRSTKGQ